MKHPLHVLIGALTVAVMLSYGFGAVATFAVLLVVALIAAVFE